MFAQEHVANKAVFYKMPYSTFGCLTTFPMWGKKKKLILFKKKKMKVLTYCKKVRLLHEEVILRLCQNVHNKMWFANK